MSDHVSKTDVLTMLDDIAEEVEEGHGFNYQKWYKEVKDLPSVQPEVTAEMVDSYVKPRHLRVISEELYLHLTAGKHLPPPIFQPEIIRCKDCEHWDTTWQNDFAPNHHYCPLVDGTRSGDFYCADAERRTG